MRETVSRSLRLGRVASYTLEGRIEECKGGKPQYSYNENEPTGWMQALFHALCHTRLPSEPMLLANLRIYFADFPECTFLYVPEHFMLGDLMR